MAWPRVAAVASMVAFSLPTFVTGLEVSHGLKPTDALLALAAGSVIIVIIGAIMGSVGARTRMSSYVLVRIAFGDRGAGLVNIAFAISLLGWFGVNINLFTGAVGKLAETLFSANIGPIWLSLIASVCMTLTTLIGFRAINVLSTLLVPVLAVVTFLLAKAALGAQPLSETLALDKPASLTVGDGVSAVVGAIIVGAIILPDITRFVRHWSGAIYTAFIAYIIVQLSVMGTATLAGSISGKTDILDIMLDINLGFGAFAIVIAGSWALNSLNLYSTVLSVKATFPKLNTTALTLVLGAVGVVTALMNILDQFVTFLFYLSVVFIPVAGVIIVDYLVIRGNEYRADSLASNQSINVKAFAAWAIGAVYSLAAAQALVPTLSNIAAIDAVALSALTYLLLAWPERRSTTDAQP